MNSNQNFVVELGKIMGHLMLESAISFGYFGEKKVGVECLCDPKKMKDIFGYFGAKFFWNQCNIWIAAANASQIA